jgi:predicted enzyme involved in methoxymalonyl-ACP biosynthesis
VVHAADRFGDYGLVGVCAMARPTPEGVVAIDTLLMSCRALGRGVEDAFLHAMASVAAGAGGVSMRAPLVAGPRNAQVATFLARQGFEEATPAVWIRSLTDRPALPAHVQLRLDLSASLVDAD